tara:strand:+ start:700 stop:855 length:156 start_codon:yes stop_codon:yes gene_type:complete
MSIIFLIAILVSLTSIIGYRLYKVEIYYLAKKSGRKIKALRKGFYKKSRKH